jgi:AcrR family transcriptional regulator
MSVLKAAGEVFREEGYERASMNHVAKRLGGSKGTLYSYFSSKQELFAAAMLSSIEGVAFDAFHLLEADVEVPLEKVLTAFGSAYLRFLLREELLEITRLAIAEAKAGDWGARLYAETVGDGLKSIQSLLARRLPSLTLPEGGIEAVARQYRAVLTSDLIERRLRNIGEAPDEAAIDRMSRAAAALIVRAYENR